jgi:DMSO reductase anchor subunit
VMFYLFIGLAGCLMNLKISRSVRKLTRTTELYIYIYILSDQQILKINHCINLFNNFKKIQTHKANSKSNYLHQHNVDRLLSLVSVITLAVTKNSKKEQPPPPPPSFFPLVSLSSF